MASVGCSTRCVLCLHVTFSLTRSVHHSTRYLLKNLLPARLCAVMKLPLNRYLLWTAVPASRTSPQAERMNAYLEGTKEHGCGRHLPREKLLGHHEPSLCGPTESLLLSHDTPVILPLLLSQDFYLGQEFYQCLDRLLKESPNGSF